MSGFTAADVPDVSGRNILITGANTGIGYEAAKVLAGRGANVIMACRDEAKAAAAMARIVGDFPSAQVQFLPLDLSDLASVRAAADRAGRLDILINNAGIMRPPLAFTKDGFELQFGINHLGHFALTALLLGKISGPDPRVVTVSSIAHKRGNIDFANLDGARSYQRSRFYCQSKLANLLFATELGRRLKSAGSKVKSAACHPGLAGTTLGRHGKIDSLLGPAGDMFFNTAAQGAWPTLQAATDPGVTGGEYFGPQGIMDTRGKSGPARRTKRSTDRVLAARLWDVSVEMTGIDPGLPPA